MRRTATFALLALWSAAAAATAPIEGLWLTDDRKGVVRIGPCGRQLCGWVARVLDHGPDVPTRDVRNPDPRLRGRPILGLPTLTGFSGAGGQWTGGRAYDPEIRPLLSRQPVAARATARSTSPAASCSSARPSAGPAPDK